MVNQRIRSSRTRDSAGSPVTKFSSTNQLLNEDKIIAVHWRRSRSMQSKATIGFGTDNNNNMTYQPSFGLRNGHSFFVQQVNCQQSSQADSVPTTREDQPIETQTKRRVVYPSKAFVVIRTRGQAAPGVINPFNLRVLERETFQDVKKKNIEDNSDQRKSKQVTDIVIKSPC
ncbi:unnamed protein product [Caenorhabditis brenneri]